MTCNKTMYHDMWSKGRPCGRKVWKDGFCKIHHPESVKARQDRADARWEERKKQLPWYKLQKAEERIAELEKENKKLRSLCLCCK